MSCQVIIYENGNKMYDSFPLKDFGRIGYYISCQAIIYEDSYQTNGLFLLENFRRISYKMSCQAIISEDDYFHWKISKESVTR